jgi:DNA-binding transcriptional ArsR family regulator
MTKQMKEFADSIRAMRDQEDAEIEKLEAQIAHHRDLQKRMTKAIEALDPREAEAKGSSQRRSMPSQEELKERMVAVWQVVRKNDAEGVTIKQIMEATGLTHSNVTTAIDALRQDEVVRKAGVGGPQNNANVYKLMKSDSEPQEMVNA